MPPTTQLDPNAPPPMLVKAAQSMTPLFAQPVSAAEHAISDASPPPNSGPAFGPQIDPADQLSAELKSGESKPPDPLEVSGDAAAQQGGQDKNLTDAIDRGAADAQHDKPVLAEQGPSNPILHFLSRITGRTGPQPSPGEKYEGPTTDKEKNAAVPKFLSNVGNAMVSIGGRPQEQEFEQKRPMMQREQELELAKLNNTLHYQEGMIDTRQEQNRIREQNAQGHLAKQGMTVDEATGKVRPMTMDEIADNPVLNQDIDVRKATAMLKRAQSQKAINDIDVLNNPDNPTFRQRQQKIDNTFRLAQQMISSRFQFHADDMAMRGANLSLAERRTDALYGDPNAVDENGIPMARLNPGAQKVLMESEPVHDQIKQLRMNWEGMRKPDGTFDRKMGKYLADRALYAMGIHTPIGEMADAIAGMELNRVAGAARILRGSSRAIQALTQAMNHLPNMWTDSDDQINTKLINLDNALEQIRTETIQYGQKSGLVPTTPTTPPLSPGANSPVNSRPNAGGGGSGNVIKWTRGADGKLHPPAVAAPVQK